MNTNLKQQTPLLKRGFRLLLCSALLSTLVPGISQAQTAQEAEMAKLYEQAFGKKNQTLSRSAKFANAPALPVNASEEITVQDSTVPETDTSEISVTAPADDGEEQPKEYSQEDLSSLYSQAFGKPPAHQLIKSSSDEPDSEEAGDESTGDSNDLASLYAQAFGGKAPMAMASKLVVDFRVNKVAIGEITAYSNKSGVMDRVDTATLIASLEEVLKDHIYKRIKKQLEGKKQTAIKTLDKLGIKAAYNSINLSLDIQVDPTLRKPQVLSLVNKRKATVREENRMTANEISAFLNMYSSLGLNSNTSKTDFKIKLDGSLNINNRVLETTVDINNDNVSLGRTSITYDKPEKLQRFVVGNISTGSRNFQENLELIGIRGSKEFFMEPELQIRPRANQAFILETDSTVEVYINDQLRQRFYLNKGVYSLEDIGLYDGANNIRVKITDEFGKVTTKTSQQFYDSHLLKPGLSLYSASLGYLKDESSSNENLENKPILSAYYEKGINKDLTMSLDAQISPDSYLLGAEALNSISLGSLKTSVALSGGKDKGTGYAARLEFKPNIQREVIKLDTLRSDMLGLDTKVGQFVNSMTIVNEYRSRDFALLNEVNGVNAPSNRLRAQLQTQFSFNLTTNWRGTLNLAATDYYDTDDKVSAHLTANRRFNNGVNLSVGASVDNHNDLAFNLQLTIPLDRHKRNSRRQVELLADSEDNSFSSKLSYKPLGQVGRDSLSGSIETLHSDNGDDKKLNLNYRDTNFETQISAYDTKGANSNSHTQRFNVGFNSSIACVGKECATSYPINDSFALVKGPSNQVNPIAVKNGYGSFKYSDTRDSNLPIDYTSLIPGKGKNAVVPLESYRYQNINIDEATLPDGYDSEKTEFEVFPRYHQGFSIKAGGEPATILDGELVDEEGKPLGFKGGQWVSTAEDGKTIAFFSNKAGRFRIGSIPAGRYVLELFDYPDMQAINVNVPNKKGQVHDVGALKITE